MADSVNLCSLIEQFGSEEKCRAYLEALRWPDKMECPRCAGETISKITKRNQYDCDACRYQFSVTAGTVFNDSHLPLWKWFLCTYLLCESRKGMSANQIKRTLGISYKTAWYLCHRVRSAMREVNPERLGGTVEVDETYIGGAQRGHQHKPGHPMCKKEIVIGIRQRGGETRFFHAEDAKSGTLARYIRENVSSDVDVIMTDEYMGYPGAMKALDLSDRHKTIKHKSRVHVDGNIHTNSIESAFSLLKRGIIGSWHKVSAKHLAAYLDEMTFRFNNRNNPFLFRDTMLKLIEAPVLEYKELIAA